LFCLTCSISVTYVILKINIKKWGLQVTEKFATFAKDKSKKSLKLLIVSYKVA
jgi:hypothetical protein